MAARLRSHPDVLNVAEGDGEVRASLADPDAAGTVVAAAVEAGPVGQVRTEQPTLEDVFLALTGRAVRD